MLIRFTLSLKRFFIEDYNQNMKNIYNFYCLFKKKFNMDILVINSKFFFLL